MQIAEMLRQEELNFQLKVHEKKQLDKRHERAVIQLHQNQETIEQINRSNDALEEHLDKFEAELDLIEANYNDHEYGGSTDQDRLDNNEALRDLIKDIDKCDQLYMTYQRLIQVD